MRSRLLPVVLLVVAVATPVHASLVDKYVVSGDLLAARPGENATTPRFAIFTGAFVMDGSESGVLSAAGTHGARVEAIDHLEVYPAKQGNVPTAPTKTYDHVDLAASDNSTLVYYAGSTVHRVHATSAFAMAVPIDMPDRVGDVKLHGNTSLALVGASNVTMEMAASKDALLLVETAATRIEVRQANKTLDTYDGKAWAFRLVRHATLMTGADNLLLPFSSPEGTGAVLRPAPVATAQALFNLAKLPEAYKNANPGASNTSVPSLDAGVVDQFRQATPIFNGALLGTLQGNATVGGHEERLGAFTLVRYGVVNLSPGAERGVVHYVASSAPFVLAGPGLYSSKASVGGASLPFPLLSLVLWILAAAAIVLGFVLKPFVAPHPANAAGSVRLASLLFRLVCILVVFVAWDFETRAFLGTSVLQAMGGGGARGVAFTAILGVQGITWLLAWAYFGLPVRFLVNTVLKLASMKRARGVGKGVAQLAAWGLGAPAYALLLAPFIGLFVDALGKLP